MCVFFFSKRRSFNRQGVLFWTHRVSAWPEKPADSDHAAGGWGGGGVLWLIFAWYVPLASQSPYPDYDYSVANCRPHLCHFWVNLWFSRSQYWVTIYFHEPTLFLDWMKNTLLFICSTNILVRLLTVNAKNCVTPKNPKMCDPILDYLKKYDPTVVNPVVKMRPHPATHPH